MSNSTQVGELLPCCPFCSEAAEVFSSDGLYGIHCVDDDCACGTPMMATYADALAIWTRRATPSPVGASVLWSDERITNEAYEFAKKEGAHSTDAVEMIARRMRNDYEAHRGASVPSEVMETIKESVNYAKKSVNELGKRSLTQREIDFAIARFDAALTWLAQQRGQG